MIRRRRRWCTSRRLAVLLLTLMFAAALWVTLLSAAHALEPYFSGNAMHDGYREESGSLPWAMVIANDVNLRAGPGMECAILCQRSYGTAVEVLGEWQGWVKCLSWTHTDPVWIWGEYLEMVD